MVNKDLIARELYEHFWNANTNMPLDRYDDYEIDDQGLVHVHVDIQSVAPSISGRLPVQFSEVDGDFLIINMNLTSLVGAPTHVEGIFDCSHNLLMSLEHAPKTCGYFNCQGNKLTHLAHAPQGANSIDCSKNLLTDLSTCPGSQDVFAAYNPFETFKDTPTDVERVTITYAPNLPLLGLLTMHHVEIFDPDNGEYKEDLSKILNAHVGKGVSNKASMLKCAGELIKSGYKGNARW
jgi:hypothetical protein